MASTVRHKRSSTAGAIPTTAQLPLGELAINTRDGKLFLKKDVLGTESIVEVGAGAGAGAGVLTARCASTANQALSGGTAFPTIDGVTVAAGDLVLLKNQTAAAENGLYIVGGTGAAWTLTRASTMDAAAEAAAQTVAVQSGTSNGGKRFTTSFKSTDTLGTTAMVWDEMASYENGSRAFMEFSPNINQSVTLSATENTLSVGPITIATGVTVTVPTGGNWVIVG